jgi:hypothetical protein
MMTFDALEDTLQILDDHNKRWFIGRCVFPTEQMEPVGDFDPRINKRCPESATKSVSGDCISMTTADRKRDVRSVQRIIEDRTGPQVTASGPPPFLLYALELRSRATATNQALRR